MGKINNKNDIKEKDLESPLDADTLVEWYKNLSKENKQAVTEFFHSNLRLTEKDDSKLTHKAIGRLVFQQLDKNGKEIPIHNMLVEFYDNDTWSPDDFLGTGYTDKNGYFEIKYNPEDFKDEMPLVNDNLCPELRILETYFTYDGAGNIKTKNKVIETIYRDELKELVEVFDFGTIAVPHWEYKPDSPLPRVLIVEHGHPPESYSPGRNISMLKTVAPLEVLKIKHLAINKLNSHLPSVRRIQKDYPEPLSIKLERENPGITRSDEYFGERMMNGMMAAIIEKDPQNPEWYWLYHHWNSYEQDGRHAMPNVDIRFAMKDGLLVPVRLTFNLRQPGLTEANAPTEKITVTPKDGKKWKQAKRLARVSATLHAELEGHLCATHLNTEQYAIAANRNIRKNPIKQLIFPHLKEVCLVNHTADKMLLGEQGYIIRSTAFTAESINQKFLHVMGGLDWKNWEPRKPISDKHTYALTAAIYWNFLKDYIHDFFEKNKQEIAEHWFEIFRFSTELIEHSVPFFLCSYLSRYVQKNPQNSAWFDRNERIDLNVPRYKVDGVEKAISPITLSETMDEEGFENLKQVCAYVIYHTTFAHTYTNSRQYDDCGEVVYNSLGLRYGDNGMFVPESDLSIAPTNTETSEMLFIGNLLSKTNYGFITKNEDHDIHPDFIKALKAKKAAFEKLGFDINTIQSRANI